MATIKFSIESVHRQLSTLKPTIEALLKCQSPTAPIVKEKIEQAERIICSIPLELELESVAKSWHGKLAVWWVDFAVQQNPTLFLPPSEEELNMITPPSSPFSVSPFSVFPFSAIAVPEKPQVVSPSTSVRPKAVIAECKSTFGPVPSDFNWTSAQAEPVSAPVAPKERRPSGSSSQMKGVSRAANAVPAPLAPSSGAAPAVPAEPEPVFAPLPNDFDWVSGPAIPKQPRPARRQNTGTHKPGQDCEWD